MKNIFTIIYFLGALLGNQSDVCKLNIGDLSFLQPNGFEITNTWAENGVLSMFETASGNGMDILVDTKIRNFDDKIMSIREEWSKSIINEEKLTEGGHVFRIRNASKIQPVDTIILVPKTGFIIEAYLMKSVDSGTNGLSTHGAFEDKALEILSSIEQGGKNEKRAFDCLHGLLLSF